MGRVISHSPFGRMGLENRDLPTPIDVERLAVWLEGYNESKKEFLLNGFSEGFCVGFKGETNNSVPENLTSAKQMPEIVTDHTKK